MNSILTLIATVAALYPGSISSAASPVAKVDAVGFCKPYTWLFGGWTAAPRIPLLADVNGDGYADFLYATPQEKIIDVSLNGHGLKPVRGQRLISDLPEVIEGYCTGRFKGTAQDIAVLGAKGAVTLAVNNGKGEFSNVHTIAHVDGISNPAWIGSGHVSSPDHDDIIVSGSNGHIETFGSDGKKNLDFTLNANVEEAVIGAFHHKDHAELAVRSDRKILIFALDSHHKRLTTISAPEASPRGLAAGDINGDCKDDLLIDGRAFIAPGFKKAISVPGWIDIKQPVKALLAEVEGRHRADLVVQLQGKDYYGSKEADCRLYVTYLRNDEDWDNDGLSNSEELKIGSDPFDRSTSHDGLLDGWKVNGFDGINLKAMGASPLHKDIFVMNVPREGVPIDQMERYTKDKIAPFFAALPVKNLDGTKGYAIHAITQPVIPTKGNENKSWQQIAGENFPADRYGMFHWLLVGGMGGGGQSDELADSGSTGMMSWIHEFGHQLGLSHSGKYQTWAPTYTSLMNYSYSYHFDGSAEKIHFSTGEFANLVLNESHLPGKVPFSYEKLKFLEGAPYRFHLKPAGSDATYIDWGWSGEFVDRTLRANITFGYSVSGGERLQPSGTKGFNYDGPYELMTDHQAAFCEHQGKLYMATANRPPVEPSAPRPASCTLVLQTYMGRHAWSAPRQVTDGVTGDPAAVSDGKSLYLIYPTAEGIRYMFGDPDALSEPVLIPNSRDSDVSAVNWNGRALILLRRAADLSIRVCSISGGEIAASTPLTITSTISPGATVDTIHHQLLVGTAVVQGAQKYRWQLNRLEEDGKGGFKIISHELLGGDASGWAGSRRPTLIFNPSNEYGSNGKIYWIAAGVPGKPGDATGFYIGQTIGYKDKNNGWLLWRYYDEWTNTRSGVSAAYFDNDIVLATTWASGTAGGDCGVFLGYNGMAIGNVDMGDFDDITLMTDYGIERSIGTFAKMPQ